jgi:hypothetical protein
MNVLVFSTSVKTATDINFLTPFINSLAGKGNWNFALDDCDHVLRIISDEVKPIIAIELLRSHGYQCTELD